MMQLSTLAKVKVFEHSHPDKILTKYVTQHRSKNLSGDYGVVQETIDKMRTRTGSHRFWCRHRISSRKRNEQKRQHPNNINNTAFTCVSSHCRIGSELFVTRRYSNSFQWTEPVSTDLLLEELQWLLKDQYHELPSIFFVFCVSAFQRFNRGYQILLWEKKHNIFLSAFWTA